jgi:hypothetical protein
LGKGFEQSVRQEVTPHLIRHSKDRKASMLMIDEMSRKL